MNTFREKKNNKGPRTLPNLGLRVRLELTTSLSHLCIQHQGIKHLPSMWKYSWPLSNTGVGTQSEIHGGSTVSTLHPESLHICSSTSVDRVAEKHPRVCRPARFKPMLFTGWLCFLFSFFPGSSTYVLSSGYKTVEAEVSMLRLSARSATRLTTTNLRSKKFLTQHWAGITVSWHPLQVGC